MSESDKMLERCIECGLCVKECDFLQMHCESPRDLAESFKAGKHRTSPEIPYSCNLCGLCEVRCPEGLNVGRMCFEVRHQLVQEGLAPLKPHQPLRDAQDWYVSDAFRLALPSPESLKSSDASGSGKTIRAFFPGCALSAYSPDLVINAYEYLLQKLPGTGIVLGCCGAPAYLIGGASEIIVACPCCYLVLKQYQPHLNPISLNTVLAGIGLPEAKPTAGAREKHTFSIHDPCSSRFEGEVHNSVRKLIEACGHEVEEIEHSKGSSHCCGLGGMAFAVDANLSAKIARHTIDETRSDLVTYCASCRGHLASQGAHILHLLDLVFNDDRLEDRFAPAADPSEAMENQRQLKLRLLK